MGSGPKLTYRTEKNSQQRRCGSRTTCIEQQASNQWPNSRGSARGWRKFALKAPPRMHCCQPCRQSRSRRVLSTGADLILCDLRLQWMSSRRVVVGLRFQTQQQGRGLATYKMLLKVQKKTPNFEKHGLRSFLERPVLGGFIFPPRTTPWPPLVSKKMLMNSVSFMLGKTNVKEWPHVCALSGQSSLPCSELQMMKNIDMQPRKGVGLREQFGGWRRPCDWTRVGTCTCSVVWDGLAFGSCSLWEGYLWVGFWPGALWAATALPRFRLLEGPECRRTAEQQDGTLQLAITTFIANPGHL